MMYFGFTSKYDLKILTEYVCNYSCHSSFVVWLCDRLVLVCFESILSNFAYFYPKCKVFFVLFCFVKKSSIMGSYLIINHYMLSICYKCKLHRSN